METMDCQDWSSDFIRRHRDTFLMFTLQYLHKEVNSYLKAKWAFRRGSIIANGSVIDWLNIVRKIGFF